MYKEFIKKRLTLMMLQEKILKNPDHLYRTLIIDILGSRKTNTLLNLISH